MPAGLLPLCSLATNWAVGAAACMPSPHVVTGASGAMARWPPAACCLECRQAGHVPSLHAFLSAMAACTQVVKELKPTMATANPTMLGTNVLHEIDQGTQEIVDAIVEAQAQAAGGAAEVVRFGEGLAVLTLKQAVTLAGARLSTQAICCRLGSGARPVRGARAALDAL